MGLYQVEHNLPNEKPLGISIMIIPVSPCISTVSATLDQAVS